MAILAALVRRATTGEGAFLDVSIADGENFSSDTKNAAALCGNTVG